MEQSNGGVDDILEKLDTVLQMAVAASAGLLSIDGKTALPPSDNNGNTPIIHAPEGGLYKLMDNLLFLQVRNDRLRACF